MSTKLNWNHLCPSFEWWLESDWYFCVNTHLDTVNYSSAKFAWRVEPSLFPKLENHFLMMPVYSETTCLRVVQSDDFIQCEERYISEISLLVALISSVCCVLKYIRGKSALFVGWNDRRWIILCRIKNEYDHIDPVFWTKHSCCLIYSMKQFQK